MRAGKYVSVVSECNYEKEQAVSFLLAINKTPFFLPPPFISFFFCFPMCEYVRVYTNIPLGSRQNSFSADTFFFLSLFCFLNVWISKENSYQILPQKKNQQQTHKSLISMKQRFFASLKERKKEWMNERMNELGFGNITCICTTMHRYLIRLLVLCFNCFTFLDS